MYILWYRSIHPSTHCTGCTLCSGRCCYYCCRQTDRQQDNSSIPTGPSCILDFSFSTSCRPDPSAAAFETSPPLFSSTPSLLHLTSPLVHSSLSLLILYAFFRGDPSQRGTALCVSLQRQSLLLPSDTGLSSLLTYHARKSSILFESAKVSHFGICL